MLSLEDGKRLPTSIERDDCKSGTGELCHGLVKELDIAGTLGLKTSKERDEMRQDIDWVSGHCQTVQCANRLDRKNLPCLKLRETLFQLNKEQ